LDTAGYVFILSFAKVGENLVLTKIMTFHIIDFECGRGE
jgi:hypothetical protein